MTDEFLMLNEDDDIKAFELPCLNLNSDFFPDGNHWNHRTWNDLTFEEGLFQNFLFHIFIDVHENLTVVPENRRHKRKQ